MDLNPELILGLSATENGMGLVALPALLARALPCIHCGCHCRTLLTCPRATSLLPLVPHQPGSPGGHKTQKQHKTCSYSNDLPPVAVGSAHPTQRMTWERQVFRAWGRAWHALWGQTRHGLTLSILWLHRHIQWRQKNMACWHTIDTYSVRIRPK